MDEVDAAALVAPADVRFGNVVAALADAPAHALHVKLGAREARIPDVDFDPLSRRLGEQRRDGVRAERGLECEVEPLGDGFFQQPFALLPGGAVGVRLAQLGIGGPQRAGGLVGVVVIGAVRAEGRAGYAALARAVDAGQHINVRPLGRSHRLRSAATRVLAFFLAAALTAARPNSAGEALNAAFMPFLASVVCMRWSRPSNCALRSSRAGERDFTSDSNSA